ncbi:NAD(P)-dependent oxidoreductase [Salinicola halophilus]|uniref:NAD(P)-dependent oxidoreductase n=1 Tax=Salinicola halophilus TaxID=184065 RepID=UPI000DA25A8C|nr:NAD(P)-dependent oxidoreductase [Salinicola halophilus]
MTDTGPVQGVFLSATFDLAADYASALARAGDDVRVARPAAITDPEAVRFAVCWAPAADAFARYPNLELAISPGAGADALLAHPGLPAQVAIARIRDPHQADMMAGFAVHEILHRERDFDTLAHQAARAQWAPLALRAPQDVKVAVLGGGTMGRAVAAAARALGFGVSVACRREPTSPLDSVEYCWGDDAMPRAATNAHYLVNVLPLTAETENRLDRELFSRLAPGAWLVQIGRGEHLVERDLIAALDSGQLAGATLDVFREEPLPAAHPFWQDARLRLTPHVASESLPDTVAAQVVAAARALRDGQPPPNRIDRDRGY